MIGPMKAPVYTIAAVSKLTGVSCHALRVWERRYGYPTPMRSAKGHRRYDSMDVSVLQAIGSRVRSGCAIREALEEALVSAGPDLPDAGKSTARANERVEPSARLLRYLLAGDLAGAEAYHAQLKGEMTPAERVARVLEPALVEVGESYFRRDCSLGMERQASQFVLRKLTVELDQAILANREPKRSVLVGCTRGDRHEGGPLLVALALELAGWRSINLGADLPTSEFQSAIDAWSPDALAVSFVLSRNVHRRFEELSQLRGVPIFVGGRSIVNYQSLAVRHGLIPLAGRVFPAVAELIARLRNDDAPHNGGA